MTGLTAIRIKSPEGETEKLAIRKVRKLKFFIWRSEKICEEVNSSEESKVEELKRVRSGVDGSIPVSMIAVQLSPD